MPLTLEREGVMRNTPKPPNRRTQQQIWDLLEKLEYDDIFGPQKSNLIRLRNVKEQYARLDRQSPPADGGANLQIQLNGLESDSTVATALVAATANQARLTPAQIQNLVDSVKLALTTSFRNFLVNDPHIYRVAGSQP